MSRNLKSLLQNKRVLIITTAVVVLAAVLVTAALTGVLGGGKTTAEETAGDINGDADIQTDTTSPLQNAGLLDAVAEISPEESDSLGVSTTSAFRLLFSKATDEEAVMSSLNVEPQQAFSIKKLSDKEYKMEFEKPLQSNSVYNLTLNDKDTGAKKSWAFQTKKNFSVVRTLPADKSVHVPVKTGIEITFSHSGIKDPEKHIEITPEVKGRFEWNRKTLVFVPEALDQDTIYTVTVKKGISAEGSSDTLQEDYTFVFQTELPVTSKKYFSFSDDVYNFTPQTVPALEVYTMNEMAGSEVPVEIYSFPDAGSFLDNIKKNHSKPYWTINSNRDSYDLSALQKTASVNCTIVQYIENYWNRTYLLLPSSLSEGYYIVVADIDGDKYYAPLQINRTSVYIMTSKDECLAWVNDALSGQPVADAEFVLDQSEAAGTKDTEFIPGQGTSANTDDAGLAVLGASLYGSDRSLHFFTIKPKSGLPFVACVPNNTYDPWYSSYNTDVADSYWTYLHLDRGIYLPQDTVNIWGILKPRSGTADETEAELELISYNWRLPGNDSASVLSSQRITLTPDGTFTGSLRISNFNPGSYEVRVRVGERVMITQYLQVMDYTKPVYKIEAEPDRNFVYAWETVNFDIAASFFEGTPASGMKLDYTTFIDSKAKNGKLTSDQQGSSKLSLQPETSAPGWRPVMLTLSVSNSEAEEQQVREYRYVNVFPKDTMVEAETNIDGDTGTISLTTSSIDISALDSNIYGYPSQDDYRGKSVDIPITVKLYERHYEKRKTGDYYDHINKIRKDIYGYYEVKNLINEYSFTTIDGKYEIDFNTEDDKHYTAEIFTNDSEGRPITESIYIYNWDSYDPYTSTYRLSQTGAFKQYKAGEQVKAEILYNKEEPFEGENRKYLFIRMRNGIVDYTVSDSSVYQFPFDTSLIPNVYVKALCYDGSGIYDAGIIQYRYDNNEKKLDIKITTDKESYKPGDTAKLLLEVKDAKGGPVSSEVNIGIVDEAYFAFYQQYVNTLGSLYGVSISSGFLSQYLSYEPIGEFGPPMAEGGGEGGDTSVRRDFKDTAVFLTVSTDESGKAEAAFKVPDNLTSWRITCQAVSKDLQAGSSVINISSKLPFFVDSIFNKTFMTGDSPSILVRANGEELAAGAAVDFTVTVEGMDGYSISHTVKGTANTHCEVQLGTLAAGDYTVRIEGAYGSLKDAMERSFRVTDSLLETTVTDFIPLKEGTTLSNGVNGLTTLTFYNEDSSALYNELRSLYTNWGSRLDQVLARKISGKLLQNYFNEKAYIEEEFDLKKYQKNDGGLALLPYDSSSPELSAKMCSFAADDIDRGSLTFYFYSLIENENTMPEDVIYAYWGLAALKEPVLLDIRSILSQEDPDLKTRLVLGAALCEAGDHQGAAEVYNEVMSKHGSITDTLAWIDTENGTRDDNIDASALCALIAMKTDAPEKMKLFRYISSNSTSTLLVNLESMIFVTNYIKNASLVNSFTYELDGVRKQIELKKGSFFRLVLTPDKLSSLKFSGITGNIVAARSYTAPVSDIKKSPGDTVSIERNYNTGGIDSSAVNFKRSDTAKVTLTLKFSETAPDGYYEITDVLPAGFRYIQASYGDRGVSGNWYYPSEVTGQKVVFGYYYNKKNVSQDRTIEYYAKAVSPGSYTADSAALSHTDNDISGFTERTRITISD